MSRPRAVVLLSGGMDSCVTAALAARTHDLAFLHLDYGQRTERREARAFREIAAHYQVRQLLTVPMQHYRVIGGSSLTDPAMPVAAADLTSTAVPSSYVPFRNAMMLSVAVSWAEILRADALFIGAVEEDASGYPDCRKEFFDAFNAVIRVGTRPGSGIQVVTPVIRMSKEEIVRTGMRLGAPLHLTWSCYQREDVACGVCDSCALRLRGFQRAGVQDPIPYAVQPDYAGVGA
jgi:7-cyano-7-deazaguanine synthase